MQSLANYSSFQEGKKDNIALFGGVIVDLSTLRLGFEIEAYKFVEPTQLPDDTSPATRRRIHEYTQNALCGGQW